MASSLLLAPPSQIPERSSFRRASTPSRLNRWTGSSELCVIVEHRLRSAIDRMIGFNDFSEFIAPFLALDDFLAAISGYNRDHRPSGSEGRSLHEFRIVLAQLPPSVLEVLTLVRHHRQNLAVRHRGCALVGLGPVKGGNINVGHQVRVQRNQSFDFMSQPIQLFVTIFPYSLWCKHTANPQCRSLWVGDKRARYRTERMDDHLSIALRRLPCNVENSARRETHICELLRSQPGLELQGLLDQRLADARQVRFGDARDPFQQHTPRPGADADEGFILGTAGSQDPNKVAQRPPGSLCNSGQR